MVPKLQNSILLNFSNQMQNFCYIENIYLFLNALFDNRLFIKKNFNVD